MGGLDADERQRLERLAQETQTCLATLAKTDQRGSCSDQLPGSFID